MEKIYNGNVFTNSLISNILYVYVCVCVHDNIHYLWGNVNHFITLAEEIKSGSMYYDVNEVSVCVCVCVCMCEKYETELFFHFLQRLC